MPIGYEYRCDNCNHEWLLFSKRFSLGPVQWGEIKYTCFTCQTFLSVAKTIDRNSWAHWRNNNANSVASNQTLQHLAAIIDERLTKSSGLAPIELEFEHIECPTCNSDQLSTTPFGQHKMACEKCNDYTGSFIADRGISIYGPVQSDGDDAG